jgi:hypothetical protein
MGRYLAITPILLTCFPANGWNACSLSRSLHSNGTTRCSTFSSSHVSSVQTEGSSDFNMRSAGMPTLHARLNLGTSQSVTARSTCLREARDVILPAISVEASYRDVVTLARYILLRLTHLEEANPARNKKRL